VAVQIFQEMIVMVLISHNITCQTELTASLSVFEWKLHIVSYGIVSTSYRCHISWSLRTTTFPISLTTGFRKWQRWVNIIISLLF